MNHRTSKLLTRYCAVTKTALPTAKRLWNKEPRPNRRRLRLWLAAVVQNRGVLPASYGGRQ